ncbi:MAG: hypothetical protein KY475_07190 [Planctomycetes bacterium]|nr:hypothetical protein [Planctomycetota bacterium]
MFDIRLIRQLTALAAIAALATCGARSASASEDVGRQAVAVLQKYCVACHGPDVQKSGLRLDNAEAFQAGGESGEPLVGDSAETSFLWARVLVDADMPPEGKPQPTLEEKQSLAAWLRSGAAWPGADEALAVKAEGVFRKHCYACHGRQRLETPGLDFDDYASLVAPRADELTRFLVPGDLSESMIWKKIISGTMPPKSQPRLTEEEQETMQAWIAAGAPRWPQRQIARGYVSEYDTQSAILAHLRALPESSWPHQRYFSFTHVHNNTLISDEELALYKAALSKLINSLTWESEIVIPQPVDSGQTVYVVDLRDLDWTDADHWSKLFERNDLGGQERKIGYPYGIRFDLDPKLRSISQEIQRLAGSDLSKLRVRADWFVAKASRPPLYHELLELPDNALALEEQLEVDAEEDFETPDLMRGAVKRSKVSVSNRVLDRHRGLHGSYWISYDFATSSGDGDVARRPLGPDFEGHPFPDFAFAHDGGEIIFALPNGLQGYLLVDGEKKRISEGPIQIVSDANKWSGTPAVVTGISCIGCHKHGMVRFTDEVAGAFVRNGDLMEKVADLYTPIDQMNERLRKDEERFLEALLEAVKPFLPVTTTAELRAFPYEPVGEVALRYRADLTPMDVAAELDIHNSDATALDPALLRLQIQANGEVRALIGTLLEKGGIIKRETWEERGRGGNSQFQDVVSKLKPVGAID